VHLTARGAHQFTDQTWLATVKEAGGQLGHGRYPDAITKTASGDYIVCDPSMCRSIMKLRDDPAANSAMAGVLTQSNIAARSSPSSIWRTSWASAAR